MDVLRIGPQLLLNEVLMVMYINLSFYFYWGGGGGDDIDFYQNCFEKPLVYNVDRVSAKTVCYYNTHHHINTVGTLNHNSLFSDGMFSPANLVLLL